MIILKNICFLERRMCSKKEIKSEIFLLPQNIYLKAGPKQYEVKFTSYSIVNFQHNNKINLSEEEEM